MVGTIAVIYPLLKLFPSYRHMRSALLISEAYSEIKKIEQRALQAQSDEELRALVDELTALDTESSGSWISSVEINEFYSMKSALDLVRTQIIKQQRQHAKD